MRDSFKRQPPLRKPARKLVAASAITILLAGVGANAATSTSQEITEARQEAQVETTYALSPYLRAHDIKVSVKDGKATISGIVDEDVNKDLAQQIALGVSGIKRVDNQLEVKADHVPRRASAERSYGEMIDDATTTAGVKSKLLWSRHASGLNTKVETDRGRVTLQGTADSAQHQIANDGPFATTRSISRWWRRPSRCQHRMAAFSHERFARACSDRASSGHRLGMPLASGLRARHGFDTTSDRRIRRNRRHRRSRRCECDSR